MSLRRSLPLLLAVLAAACTCGDKKTPTDGMKPPEAELPRDLKPLPAAPDFAVTPEALPGAGQELAVVSSRPQGEQRGEVRPTVTFSRPVKSLEMVEAQRKADAEKPFATISPALEGEWRWLGSASAEFVPRGLVPYSTTYTVTVAKGLAALDGSQLKADFTFSFSTPRLELQDVAPARGYRWVAPDSTFSLLFNQPVKDADLLQALRVTVKDEGLPWRPVIKSRVSIQEERRKAAEEAKKAGRPYDRMADEDRGWKNQQTRYVLGFEKPLPLGREITLTVDAALHGEQGPLTVNLKDFPLHFETYGPFKLSSARFCDGDYDCPYGPLVVSTTNEAELDTFKGKVKVTPPVELDWENARAWAPRNQWDQDRTPYVEIPGKFRPGTRYTVAIAPGAADVFKQTDTVGDKVTLRTSDLPPALVTGSYLGLVEATKDAPKVPVEVSNLKSLDVKMWKLTVEEFARHVARPPYDAKPLLTRAPDFQEREGLTYPKNHARVHPLQLSRVFGEAKTGLALVSVTSPDLEHPPRDGYRQLVQVTDLAAHIKTAPTKSLAWVTRLSDGAPVGGAEVAVYDEAGNKLWAGATTAEGFADVPGTVELKVKNPRYQWEYPFLLMVAQKDGDVSATANTWASGVEPYEFGLSQGWEGEAPDSASFIFSERGIYRPGDTVYLKGVVRYRVLGELRAPAEGSTLKVQVSDSRSNKVKEQVVKVTKYGTFSLSAVVPKEAPTGYYSVSAEGQVPNGKVSVSSSFRVEEYRAPQFRVDVEAKKKSLVAGEALEGSVFARYLFGGAMSDAPVKWSVQRTSTSFAPEAGRTFTFAQETWWWDDGEPHDSSGFFASGEGRADNRGELAVKAGVTEAPGEKPYEYTLEAEVTDVNRQAVAGRASVTVHPAQYYVGLRADAYFMEVGKEYPIQALVLDTEGQRAAGRAVDVTITSRTWKSVKKKDASGGFSTVSEPTETEVAKCALKSAEGAVPCQFKPATAGFFIVRAAVKDDQGRRHSSSMGVYATGADWVAWQRNDTDRVELIVDKTSYDVGDVAKVLIKSPYPAAKAMLTVEREGVLERRLLDLKGSVVAVEVPITEAMVPNVYAGVVIMRPRVAQGGIETGDDPGRPNARIGLVKLNVERKSKRLAVAVKTDKKEYQPRDKVTVNLELKDASGKPASGEVTLYVVDEAVLRLTAYETPDPIGHIYPERPLSVRLGEPLLHLVRKRNYGEKGEARGGGGGNSEGSGFRTNFKTTVLFNPTLEAKDGAARAQFELPDNLTTFRVMAVVVTQTDKFGSGESSIQVNKPVMALPAMPRFARVGDKFEAGVVVHSHGAGAGEVTVTARVEGGAQLAGPGEQKVQVAEGAPKEVRFAFLGAKPGRATFRFKASNGANTDGVEEKIPVELPADLETVATYGDTKDTRVEGLAPPKDAYEDMGGLTVSMSSTSLGNFAQGFQQLIEYPYGCLEQQSSRLVPFVALREISGQFGVPWPGADKKKLEETAETAAFLRTYLFPSLEVTEQKDPDKVIASTVRSILALQDGDGSFRYWPSSYCSSSWSSAYATMALSRAKDVGFDVPPEALVRAEGYLGKVVGGSCHPCEYGCDLETRAFASYVLARMKRPRPSNYGELYQKREQLSLFGRALLANAMYVGGGDRGQANALMQELLNHAKESPKGVHFEEVHGKTYATYFHSDTRTTGVVLQALTNITPDHPYVSKMAQYLTSVRQGSGEWRSTQEAAFSLMALTEVLRTKEKETPDFKASLLFGSAPLMEQAFKGRSMAVQTRSVPMKELLAKAQGQPQKLSFQKEGAGVLYYSAVMRYAQKQMPTQSLDSGLYVQRWFEPYAGGGQAMTFYAGDLVRVRVRVASNQERHWAAIEVPLPAGLEPVDTSLATTARQTRGPDEESRGMEYDAEGSEDYEGGEADGPGGYNPWLYGFWSPFTFTEMRDNRVVVFADHLPPGVHVTSFVTRATTPGTYVLKPARGGLMYEPEVWGRSEGGSFEVVLPQQVTQK